MLFRLARWWLGPLPMEEVFPAKKPPFLRHWFFHPIKRHLAKYYLAFLRRIFGLKVIAITGSVGKTTTKEMLFAILNGYKPTVATAANITPTYNIPTTILRCSPRTRYLILEMGVEYRGDMDFYNWLARPDIAVITAVDLSHTYYLNNLETVAEEKSKIAKFADYLIIPASDPNIRINTKGQVMKIQTEYFQLPKGLAGSHFNLNASLAVAVAKVLKVPEKYYAGLNNFTLSKHRMELIELSSGSVLIDDTYNSSPLAVRVALQALFEKARELNKIPVFVFGQMNELGEQEKTAHHEVGELLAKYRSEGENFELFTIGPAAQETKSVAGFGKHVDGQDDLLELLLPLAQDGEHLILLKASRSWELDKLVEKLVKIAG